MEQNRLQQKLAKLGKEVFITVAKGTDNLMEAKQTMTAFPMIIQRLVENSKIKVKDLDMSELNESSNKKSNVFTDLFKLLENETVDDAKQLLNKLFGKVSELQMKNELDQKLEDLIIPVFNEKTKEKTEK